MYINIFILAFYLLQLYALKNPQFPALGSQGVLIHSHHTCYLQFKRPIFLTGDFFWEFLKGSIGHNVLNLLDTCLQQTAINTPAPLYLWNSLHV